MYIWHLPDDTSRAPYRVSPGEVVVLNIGTWPIEAGQEIKVNYRVDRSQEESKGGEVEALWQYNQGPNSYWRAEIGPFERGDQVRYTIHGSSLHGNVSGPSAYFRVGPKLYLAILWHQHQPIYKDTTHKTQQGSYIHPWVRLHAIRDYYSMAALVEEHPGVHLTINLTPALLWQLEDYTERGATDRTLELTRKPAETLSLDEQEQVVSTFFDAHWHNQIFPHPRYKELFTQQREGRPFTIQDLRDLQMWFNLAWFGEEFRSGKVRLVTGENTSVQRFIHQARGFSQDDIQTMIAEQYKIMRAVIPIHRDLQDQRQIEVATSPFYHPILPLLMDTDQATIDRPGAFRPPRFAHPEDAEAQVKLAAEYYQRLFGCPPRGMWPAEGAVSQSVIPLFARHNVNWLATDRGVLARSGRWGYRVDKPDVLCQTYRAEEGEDAISLFFRDTKLSDEIGFHFHAYADQEQGAAAFLHQVKERFAWQVNGDEDRVLPVVLDGENAWGAYREDARPFLRALYRLLGQDHEIQTVTFGEYLEGNPARDLSPHPPELAPKVYDLFTASWIDENGSWPGVDLGTWIGEVEENRGWELLGRARDFLSEMGATPEKAPAAFEALYMAEGSDWFWWFGDDQESGNDEEFDDLFRTHLRNIYHHLGTTPPAELDSHIVPHTAVWTFTDPLRHIQPGDQLTLRTNCPGILTWRVDHGAAQEAALIPAGGVMAGIRRYHLVLGPIPSGVREVRFTFRCTHPGCDCRDVCCSQRESAVTVS